jgi:hypothetical protein
MIVASYVSDVHMIRVVLADGTTHDLPDADLRLARASRIATALAGWLAVDEWEAASRFVPTGVRRVRRSLLKLDPDLDLAGAEVRIVRPATGPGSINGVAVVAAFAVGARTPAMLRSVRAEAAETGWREDAAHPAAAGPRGHAEALCAERAPRD